ncbi:MAG: helix-hairpin-helix domain-containing protein [Peptoniphilaceae bacterium]
MKKFLTNKTKLFICVVLIILVYIVKISIDVDENDYYENNFNELTSSEVDQSIKFIDNKVEEIPESIYIHISGRVKNPGLVELKSGSRVIDAINSAGGMYEDADLDSVNLAKKLSDEEKIYVAKKGEVDLTTYTESSNHKININTANSSELENLPGVGPKTAEKIIKYREENKFNRIEDIMNVGGFGQKKFEDVKDFITTK